MTYMVIIYYCSSKPGWYCPKRCVKVKLGYTVIRDKASIPVRMKSLGVKSLGFDWNSVSPNNFFCSNLKNPTVGVPFWKLELDASTFWIVAVKRTTFCYPEFGNLTPVFAVTNQSS